MTSQAPLRLHAHRGDWDRKEAQYTRLQRLGLKTMQLLLPDLWVMNITGRNSFSTLNDPAFGCGSLGVTSGVAETTSTRDDDDDELLPPSSSSLSSSNQACWPGDGGDWSKFDSFVADTVRAAPATVAYDIWNEPGISPGYFWNRYGTILLSFRSREES